MKSSIKVYGMGLETECITIRYGDMICNLVLNNVPIGVDDSIIIETTPGNNLLYKHDPYDKISIYCYKQKGKLIFNLSELDISSDNISMDEEFMAKLKAFIPTYLIHEISNTKLLCGEEEYKWFYMARFYFKMNLMSLASRLVNIQVKEGVGDRKGGIYELLCYIRWHSIPIKKSIAVSDNNTYSTDYREQGAHYKHIYHVISTASSNSELVVLFMLELLRKMSISDFYHYNSLIDYKSFRYVDRIYYFLQSSMLLEEKGNLSLAHVHYVNAYFSIQDGINIDLKLFLFQKCQSLGSAGWGDMIKDVIKQIRKNESPEIQLLMQLSSVNNVFMENCIETNEDTHIDIRIRAMDKIISFQDKHKSEIRDTGKNEKNDIDCSIYCSNTVFNANTIYYKKNLIIETNTQLQGLTILDIQVDGGESIHLQNNIEKGRHLSIIPLPRRSVISGIRYKYNNKIYRYTKANCMIVMVDFKVDYKLISYEIKDAVAFITLNLEMKELSNPNIFLVSRQANIDINPMGKSCLISYMCNEFECIDLMCEVREHFYKRYTFKILGSVITLIT